MTTVLFLKPKKHCDGFFFNSLELVSLLILCDVLIFVFVLFFLLELSPGGGYGRQAWGLSYGLWTKHSLEMAGAEGLLRRFDLWHPFLRLDDVKDALAPHASL